MTTRSNRDRTAILADINGILAQGTVAWTLTAKTRELTDGTAAVYHQIQRWDRRARRNVTVHVPAGNRRMSFPGFFR